MFVFKSMLFRHRCISGDMQYIRFLLECGRWRLYSVCACVYVCLLSVCVCVFVHAFVFVCACLRELRLLYNIIFIASWTCLPSEGSLSGWSSNLRESGSNMQPRETVQAGQEHSVHRPPGGQGEDMEVTLIF